MQILIKLEIRDLFQTFIQKNNIKIYMWIYLYDVKEILHFNKITLNIQKYILVISYNTEAFSKLSAYTKLVPSKIDICL